MKDFQNKSVKESRSHLDKIRFELGRPNRNTTITPILRYGSRNFIGIRNRAIPGNKDINSRGAHIMYQSTGRNSGPENAGKYFPNMGIDNKNQYENGSIWIIKAAKDRDAKYRFTHDPHFNTYKDSKSYEHKTEEDRRHILPIYKALSNQIKGVNTPHDFYNKLKEHPHNIKLKAADRMYSMNDPDKVQATLMDPDEIKKLKQHHIKDL